MSAKPCIAVVSPFLDRSHGTERCILEQIERLARDYSFEIHLFCQHVEDLENVERWTPSTPSPMPGRIFWHKVSAIPGPHLFRFLWWMAANRFRRWRDARSGRLRFDLVYSPGINCLDADAVTVHVVFHELVPRTQKEISGMAYPFRAWPRRIHRWLYYHLHCRLEERIYTRPELAIAAVSLRSAAILERHFGRPVARVIHHGVDLAVFRPEARLPRRSAARQRFAFHEKEFVALLIGNDWRNKGLSVLLEAAASCADMPWKLLVVGQEDRNLYRDQIVRLGLTARIQFAAPSSDVLQFYAAADAYVGPSLEEAFGLPILEAMACGLPVIVSAQAGVSELVHDGADALVLRDPGNAAELARLLRLLLNDTDLREKLGENAARTAQEFTWEKNAAQTRNFLEAAMLAKDVRKKK